MSGHTPGPWDNGKTVLVRGLSFLATAHFDTKEGEANARLIAAAPDLLELVKLVHGSFGGGRLITFSDEDIEAFGAAIAKAEGRS